MATTPSYVVRSTRAGFGGDVTYTVVDMAGRVVCVTLPRRLASDDASRPVIEAALARRTFRKRVPA